MNSCTSKNENIKAPFSFPDKFQSLENSVISGHSESYPLPEKWWENLGDPYLNKIIETGLGDNFTIQMAWDRLTQAEEILEQEGAQLLPSIEGRSLNQRAEFRDFFGNQVRTIWRSNFIVRFTANYELDLWGRLRANRDAQAMRFLTTKEDLHIAAISVTSEIALTWYQILELLAQKELLISLEKASKKIIDMASNRFKNGQITSLELIQQTSNAQSISRELALLEAELYLAKNQISNLIGKTISDSFIENIIQEHISYSRTVTELDTTFLNEYNFNKSEFTVNILPDLKSNIPSIGIPVAVLNNRPDVKRAILEIREADYRTASAIADRFPQITLSASVGTNTLIFEEVLKQWLYGITGNIAGPVVDGGRRRSEVRRFQAILSERINQYADVLLRSVTEVENAINREAKQRDALESLVFQKTLADKALAGAWKRYEKGAGTYLQVMDTEISKNNVYRNLMTGKRLLLENRIGLLRAIAGSFELAKPEQKKLQEISKTQENIDSDGIS
ncbi:MAG TPA: TolC family protein [Oligoflexia bacterium]|nr:TolC family protein [Oligoflexia bacterium]HMP47780.1 TolC family protein [Oligoflexia bacterium]